MGDLMRPLVYNRVVKLFFNLVLFILSNVEAG